MIGILNALKSMCACSLMEPKHQTQYKDHCMNVLGATDSAVHLSSKEVEGVVSKF